jgi:hypothetical protein
MDPAIKQLPSFVCIILVIVWLIIIIILKSIISSRTESSHEQNKYDLLIYQMPQQTASPLKKQRKSAMSRLFDSDEEESVKDSKLKKNKKIKIENLKACIDARFDVNSLDQFNHIYS